MSNDIDTAFSGMADQIRRAFHSNVLVADCEPVTELAKYCVREEWERPHDEYGERGIIESLSVIEGLYTVDVTEPVKSGLIITDDPQETTTTVYRYDSTSAVHEIDVRCDWLQGFKVGDRYYAIYEVTEAE